MGKNKRSKDEYNTLRKFLSQKRTMKEITRLISMSSFLVSKISFQVENWILSKSTLKVAKTIVNVLKLIL